MQEYFFYKVIFLFSSVLNAFIKLWGKTFYIDLEKHNHNFIMRLKEEFKFIILEGEKIRKRNVMGAKNNVYSDI